MESARKNEIFWATDRLPLMRGGKDSHFLSASGWLEYGGRRLGIVQQQLVLWTFRFFWCIGVRHNHWVCLHVPDILKMIYVYIYIYICTIYVHHISIVSISLLWRARRSHKQNLRPRHAQSGCMEYAAGHWGGKNWPGLWCRGLAFGSTWFSV